MANAERGTRNAELKKSVSKSKKKQQKIFDDGPENRSRFPGEVLSIVGATHKQSP